MVKFIMGLVITIMFYALMYVMADSIAVIGLHLDKAIQHIIKKRRNKV